MSRRERLSRYDLTGAQDLGVRGAPPSSQNVKTATVAVPDPRPNPDGPAGQRILATVNRRVDILEWERSHERLSEGAYLAGRITQAVLERASRGVGSPTWQQGSRVDAEVAKELAILRAVENARKVEGHLRYLRRALGIADSAIVEQILGQNLRYGDVRLPLGSTVVSGYETYIARRFRDALELLGAEAKAVGPDSQRLRSQNFGNDLLTLIEQGALPSEQTAADS